jgi:(p)ppGpp synthase/HD superfamily hydrolase
VDEALCLVAEAFRHKWRKNRGIPYLTHLMQVALWVAEHGGDEEQFIAGLLHDYLEDVPGADADQLRRRFGDRVTSIVEALSDSTGCPKPPWEQRKRAHLARLREMPAEVKLVAVCDKLHNGKCMLRDLRSMGDEAWEPFHSNREQNLWYYGALVEALGHGWNHPLLDELREVVADMERDASLST